MCQKVPEMLDYNSIGRIINKDFIYKMFGYCIHNLSIFGFSPNLVVQVVDQLFGDA
jgi:hypothetical protein